MSHRGAGGCEGFSCPDTMSRSEGPVCLLHAGLIIYADCYIVGWLGDTVDIAVKMAGHAE